MSLLRVILSWFYGCGSFVRNILYDENILPSFSPPIPTICVGNLAVGGTGKTPHTEYIARMLAKDFRVAVLSRGYRRNTRGFRLVDASATALTVGDEPMQMRLNLPADLPVAVCENRLKGIKQLRALYPDLQVVVLDDAYQHRSLRCGYYILLTASSSLYVHDHLLPYGRLRENKYGALRANAIVVTKCPEEMKPIERRVIETSLRLPAWQQLFFSGFDYGPLQPLFPDARPVSEMPSVIKHPLLLTAIADSGPMVRYMRTRWPRLAELAFPDHHRFRPRDMRRLADAFSRNSCDAIVTTQKDAVRLLQTDSFPDELRSHTYVLPVTVTFRNEEQAFITQLRQYVRENIRLRT